MFKIVKRYRFVRIFKLFLIAGLIIVPVFIVFALPKTVKISSVWCETQYGPCPETLTREFEQYLGKSYPEGKQLVANYLDSQSGISKYTVRLTLPGKLHIYLIQKKPKFALKGEHGPYAVIDAVGTVLTYQDSTLLPVMHIRGQPPQVGQVVDKETLGAISLLDYLNVLFEVRETKLDDDAIVVQLPGKATFVLPVGGDIQETIGSVILISRKLGKSNSESSVLNNKDLESRMEKEDLTGCLSSCVVDLRFKNPVVKL
jgi:hypothetical protein